MRIVGWTLAGLVAGAALVVLVAGIILPSVMTISQAEGAYAMSVIFLMAPVGAILGAIIGAIVGLSRRRQ
jgi:hypothetical protein